MRETRTTEFKEEITNTFLKTVSAFSNSLTIKMVTQQFEQCIRHQNYDILLIL